MVASCARKKSGFEPRLRFPCLMASSFVALLRSGMAGPSKTLCARYFCRCGPPTRPPEVRARILHDNAELRTVMLRNVVGVSLSFVAIS